MKRVQSACLQQTLHFLQKEPGTPQEVNRFACAEVEAYKEQLIRRRVKFKILEETTLEGGSVIVKLLKQYAQSPVGNYFDQ